MNDFKDKPVQEKIKNKVIQDNVTWNKATDTSKHYAHKIQPIEYIQSVMDDLPVNGFEGACIKDIIKYCSRFGLKDDKQKEAKKILDYALWLFMDVLGYTIDPRINNHESIEKLIQSN